MMKRDKYKKVIQAIKKNDKDDCVQHLTGLFPEIQRNTLGSIFSLELQRKVRKNFHKFSNSENPKYVAQLYKKYEAAVQKNTSGIILKMARDLDFSPAMLAKILLEYHINRTQSNPAMKSQLNALLRDTTKISDKHLSYEIALCQLSDCAYGPYADSIKHSIGNEYEFGLKRSLEKLGIAFQDEDELRLAGYDKTPDVKLEVPIAVGGKVINWIESKASFGDDETHRKNLKDQFWSYWNRFGSGLVIYWFGYIEDLDQQSEKGIILRDAFPTDITEMTF